MSSMVDLVSIIFNGSVSPVTLLILMVALFGLEMLFFYVPGISLTSMGVAVTAMFAGFIPTFVITFISVGTAHVILRRNVQILIPDALVLAPMVGFAAFFGQSVIGLWGWAAFGAAMGVVKWGTAIGVGMMLGQNMAKRWREIILEPIGNSLIFWKLNFIFLFLF